MNWHITIKLLCMTKTQYSSFHRISWNITRYWLLSLQKQHHTLVSISYENTYKKKHWLLTLQKQHYTLVSISYENTYKKKNIGFWLYKSNTIHWFPYLMKTHIKKKTLAFDFTKATLYIGFHILWKHI